MVCGVQQDIPRVGPIATGSRTGSSHLHLKRVGETRGGGNRGHESEIGFMAFNRIISLENLNSSHNKE